MKLSLSSFKAFLQKALLYISFISFGLCIFSIPACSFMPKLRLVTWGLTAIYLGSVILSVLMFYGFKLDMISASLLLFIVSAFISSALNIFKGFVFTPLYLAIITLFSYVYLKETKLQKQFIVSAFFGLVSYGLLFCWHYRSQLASLHFFRLGNDFGDENDIAVCLGLGFVLSALNVFFSKKKWLIGISIPTALMFAICGFATGSKTFLFITAVTSILCIVFYFGKAKWYISVIIVLGFVATIVIMLSLPMFEPFKRRILEMFSTIVGESIKGTRDDDYSTIGRIQMFFDGCELFLRKPLFGFGINGFFAHSSFEFRWSHNHFSETLCSFGLIGTIFFHVGFYEVIRHFIKEKNKNEFIIPFLIVIFFVLTMFSVALNSQKIYSYVIAVAFSSVPEIKTFYTVPKLQGKKKCA